MQIWEVEDTLTAHISIPNEKKISIRLLQFLEIIILPSQTCCLVTTVQMQFARQWWRKNCMSCKEILVGVVKCTQDYLVRHLRIMDW